MSTHKGGLTEHRLLQGHCQRLISVALHKEKFEESYLTQVCGWTFGPAPGQPVDIRFGLNIIM